jgi:hypothetical protein
MDGGVPGPSACPDPLTQGGSSLGAGLPRRPFHPDAGQGPRRSPTDHGIGHRRHRAGPGPVARRAILLGDHPRPLPRRARRFRFRAAGPPRRPDDRKPLEVPPQGDLLHGPPDPTTGRSLGLHSAGQVSPPDRCPGHRAHHPHRVAPARRARSRVYCGRRRGPGICRRPVPVAPIPYPKTRSRGDRDAFSPDLHLGRGRQWAISDEIS